MDKEGRKILVVEDHNLLLLAIRDILETEGYAVVTATNGVEALEVMETVYPSLIIADISMPRMDGYAFYEAVRARSEWVPIPFIFLTAKAEREDRLKGKSMGVEDYITKPFDPKELLITVESRIGRAKAIRAATEVEFEELKQQIVNLLSHELRTPLTSVYGYTELALEEASNLSPEEFRNFLMGIKHGADRLTRLVEDLLLLIRLDTGQAEYEFRLLGAVDTSIGEVVASAFNAQRAAAEKKGLVMQLEVADHLPPVRIYRPFLSDALGRLLDNAVKFTRGKGKKITLKAQPAGDGIDIVVADEGIGIAESDQRHLFQRFRQINRAKMEQQGIGVGLVITNDLVHAMGGAIRLESKVGEGTVCTVHLPAAEPAVQPAAKPVSQA